jgi:zinc transport system substrate-binding protein
MKKYIGLVVFLSLIGGLLWVGRGYWQGRGDQDAATTKLRVVATTYPLAFVAERVAGADAEVVTLVPTGVEPHEYEPTPQEIERVYKATVFLYNGSGLDPWADKIAGEVAKQNIVPVKATAGIPLLPLSGDEQEELGSNTDPHAWLNPQFQSQLARRLNDIFGKLDAAHAAGFSARTETLTRELSQLDADFTRTLVSCQRRDVVTSHAAFSYLAKQYNLNQIAISGVSPESEPTPARVAELVRLVKQRGITTVFFETLASPKLAETLAQEAGAKTAVLNPLEGLTQDEQSRGDNYLTLMRQNLTALAGALSCK